MNIAHYISNWWKEALEYKERVLKDGGTTKREDNVQRYYQMCKEQGILNSIKFAWLGEAGGKLRTSGANQFWTKAYSLVTTNDATQTTSTNQPYLSGNIAPNEKWCLKNPNGGDEYMTHPTISFAANEAWSVTTVITPYGSNAGVNSRILGNDTASKTRIELAPNGGTLYVYGEAANGSIAIPNRKGKRTVFHVTYNGAGVVSVSINATAIGTININDSFVFNTINRASGSQYFFGENSGVMIRAGELTLSQKQSEANFLRSIYPEIPSVTIGTQIWAVRNYDAVCTPQGNLIQEIQAATNTEKITNVADREFSSDTGFWIKGTGISILDGVCHFTNAPSGTTLYKSISTTNKAYRIRYTVSGYSSGYIKVRAPFNSSVARSSNGVYEEYGIANDVTLSTFIVFQALGSTTLDIDNVSVEEIGWVDSTSLYNYVYANTTGTAEQKDYAAVKAAAMWRSPNNDTALAATYSKLYNKFAAKLLAMDIAYYNTANPTALWEWNVPTRAQLTTLSSIGGNSAKVIGTNYWTTANGLNTSGLSVVGSGYINSSGAYTGNKTSTYLLCQDADYARVIQDADNTFNESAITVEGGVIRLLKT